MTESTLIKLATKWQKRLRLQDWKVKVSFGNYGDIEADATTTYQPKLKIAKIQICTEESRRTKDPMIDPYDPEQFLVHELLHLTHAGIDSFDGVAQDHFEVAIDTTAWALINAIRE